MKNEDCVLMMGEPVVKGICRCSTRICPGSRNRVLRHSTAIRNASFVFLVSHQFRPVYGEHALGSGEGGGFGQVLVNEDHVKHRAL